MIGAAPHECTDTRTDTRTGLRNGHRLRTLTTAAGGPERRIPKVRAGSFFPSLLERRRRVDQALFAVVMVLSHRLAPVLRGWVNYFRHGTSKATFDYLRHYAWRRVIVWLRRKHPRATGKWLRRHHRPGRWPTDGATRLATERDILRQAAKYFAGETRW